MSFCENCPVYNLLIEIENFGGGLLEAPCHENLGIDNCLSVLRGWPSECFRNRMERTVGIDPFLTYKAEREDFAEWLERWKESMKDALRVGLL